MIGASLSLLWTQVLPHGLANCLRAPLCLKSKQDVTMSLRDRQNGLWTILELVELVRSNVLLMG